MSTSAATPATSGAATRGRVFSGVQPSGLPHVGNWLGAFRNYVAMQDTHDAIYCIVDFHALTSTHDAERIRRNTYEMALGLLALGLDPEKAVLFRQSDRPEVVELEWLFASVTPTPWVERTPSFKEKKWNQPDDVNFALLSYPVLQAADIAIYKARYVPVGKDQAAHLELAREIVRAFNARYGEVFPEPEAVFTDSPIIKGTDGAAKMSKSLGNVIEIFADEDTIKKQVMSMVTDTQRIKRTDPGRPAVCNVCQLHKQFSEDYLDIWEGEKTARTGCVDTKKLLASRMIDSFAEARERRRELESKPGYVEEILRAGAERLRPIAQETMRECHERMGLGPR
ncbi:MAG: tryptophan--tRNA ligase [Chloroflexota bacterium]